MPSGNHPVVEKVQEGSRKVLLREGEHEEVLSLTLKEGVGKSEEMRMRTWADSVVVAITGFEVPSKRACALRNLSDLMIYERMLSWLQ